MPIYDIRNPTYVFNLTSAKKERFLFKPDGFRKVNKKKKPW
jgi:hypothetical protein